MTHSRGHNKTSQCLILYLPYIYYHLVPKDLTHIFYILLTLHLGTILANNQLDALPLMFLFISPLYMFRTAQCSSSGDRLY